MRILLVEDDVKMASVVRRGLEDDGFAVDVAGNGPEGQRLAEDEGYDLIILDIMLPGRDGLEVCRALRDEKIAVPVLMLTCKNELSDKVNGLNSGADDYLAKPYDIEELLARVHALLRRGKELMSDRLQAGELVMDTLARQVWHGQRLLSLAPREYAVLECLMRNPNVALSRTRIENAAWNLSMDNSSNLIDVYIRILRQKIGEEGGRLIQTVRGTGYRLTLP
jgi:DNA-binding response OmpR family regulator